MEMTVINGGNNKNANVTVIDRSNNGNANAVVVNGGDINVDDSLPTTPAPQASTEAAMSKLTSWLLTGDRGDTGCHSCR